MDPQDKIRQILDEHGAVLDRQKNHYVWKLPDGKIISLSKTPSDHRAWLNHLSDIRRQLGIGDPTRGTPGERKAKSRPKPQAVRKRPAKPSADKYNALKLAGVVKASLREKTSALLDEIRKTRNTNS